MRRGSGFCPPRMKREGIPMSDRCPNFVPGSVRERCFTKAAAWRSRRERPGTGRELKSQAFRHFAFAIREAGNVPVNSPQRSLPFRHTIVAGTRECGWRKPIFSPVINLFCASTSTGRSARMNNNGLRAVLGTRRTPGSVGGRSSSISSSFHQLAAFPRGRDALPLAAASELTRIASRAGATLRSTSSRSPSADHARAVPLALGPFLVVGKPDARGPIHRFVQHRPRPTQAHLCGRRRLT